MGSPQSRPLAARAAAKRTGRPQAKAQPLPQQFLEALKQVQDGKLIELFQFPGTAAYLENAVCWNYDAIGSPSAIFVPATEEDLAAFLRLYSSHALPAPHSLSIAGGRHSHYGMKDHAIVVDMQKFNQIEIDVEKQTGRFGGGVKLREFDAASIKHGLATTAGTNPDTGIAGLTLGGGFGWLGIRHGCAASNVLAVRAVLPNGDIIHATDDNEHKDFLWAIRGGGGNFGVITEFQFKLYKRGPVFSGANVFLTRKFTDVHATIRQWREFHVNSADNQLSGMLVLPCGGPLVLEGAYVGDDIEAGKKLVAPLRKMGNPLIDTWAVQPYANSGKAGGDLQSSVEKQQRPGNWYESGLLLVDLPDEAIEVLLKFTAERIPNKESTILVPRIAGRMNDAAAHTAVGWYRARYIAMVLGRWRNQKSEAAYIREREKVRAWTKDLMRALAPWCLASYNTLGDVALDKDKQDMAAIGQANFAAASSSSATSSRATTRPPSPGEPAHGGPISGPGVDISPEGVGAVGAATPVTPATDAESSLPKLVSAADQRGRDDSMLVNFRIMLNWSEEQFARLQDIKTRYDPANILRNNNNIKPRV